MLLTGVPGFRRRTGAVQVVSVRRGAFFGRGTESTAYDFQGNIPAVQPCYHAKFTDACDADGHGDRRSQSGGVYGTCGKAVCTEKTGWLCHSFLQYS